MKKKTLIIACAVLATDLKASAAELGLNVEFKFLEAGLHNNPQLLRDRLQAAIDEHSATDACDRIVIGYGICGKGTIGVQARSVPLILPRVHDCIALFLGGDRAYQNEFKKYPGTYYLSTGWCREKTDPGSQKGRWTYFGDKKLNFDELAAEHGEPAARQTFDFLNSWQKNYQRAAFIDTGAGAPARYEGLAREMAAQYNWRYEKIRGSRTLFKQMLNAQQSTTEILRVPPEHVIGFDPIRSTLAAHPLWQGDDLASIPDQAAGVETEDREPPSTATIKTGLGIDAGGTYTDAVIYHLADKQTLGKSKALTTKWDFTQGIREALEKLDRDKLLRVELVSLSTTLATNAIVENEGQKVGMLLMPPHNLDPTAVIAYQPQTVLQGRLDISGREITAVDPEQVKRAADRMVADFNVTAFAVSGYAGAVNPVQELQVKEILEQQTGLFVTCGHELSDTLNFHTRAVTALLNARIVPRLNGLLADLENVLAAMGINAPTVVVKGDGTLMSAALARQRPVETILSGPAASVAGARHLTGIKDALVVDMGGTTSDTAALVDNLVSLNAKGASVGGHRTHVQALEIRTAGLGGDSLIGFEKGVFHIGPRRVAPIAWLGAMYNGTSAALSFLKNNPPKPGSNGSHMQVLALTGAVQTAAMTPMEKKLVRRLQDRPYTIAELLQEMGGYSADALPLQRLEETFSVQRCGLTLTDLLHITGAFTKWDTQAARDCGRLFAALAGQKMQAMIRQLLNLGVQRLTLELLKRQLDEEVDPAALDDCPVCQTLIDTLLTKDNPQYGVSINLKRPVIGVGAPIRHFLPAAVEPLGTEAIIPEDADVANAIGAITSQVVIRKQVRIIPDELGGFRVEGIAGNHQFEQFETADRFARDELTRIVRQRAAAAGTNCRKVALKTEDRIPATAAGDPVFLGRTIAASLIGRPDSVMITPEN